MQGIDEVYILPVVFEYPCVVLASSSHGAFLSSCPGTIGAGRSPNCSVALFMPGDGRQEQKYLRWTQLESRWDSCGVLLHAVASSGLSFLDWNADLGLASAARVLTRFYSGSWCKDVEARGKTGGDKLPVFRGQQTRDSLASFAVCV